MDSKSAVRVRAEDEVVAQLSLSQKDLCPLCLYGVWLLSLCSLTMFLGATLNLLCVWCPSQWKGRGRLCAASEHHTRPVKCINLSRGHR